MKNWRKEIVLLKLQVKIKDHIAHSVLQIGNTKLMIAEDTMNTNERYNVEITCHFAFKVLI